ncbi:MAG: baseplate J/gp47 family protein, partial [Christensenella sp.]
LLQSTERIRLQLAFENFTLEYLKKRLLQAIPNETVSKIEGSFASDMAATIAAEMHDIYTKMDFMLSMQYVYGLYGEYLDRKCAEYGLIRKHGTNAAGTLSITGKPNVVLPKGIQLISDSGLVYVLENSAVISSNGTVNVKIIAAETGDMYNTNAIQYKVDLRPMHGITGVSGYSIANDLTGGTPTESDSELQARLLKRLRNPPIAGNLSAYEQLALEVDGVAYAKAVRNTAIPNSLYVFIAGLNGNTVTQTTKAACKAYIEEKKSVGAQVIVRNMLSYTINVNATVCLTNEAMLAHVAETFKKGILNYILSLREYGGKLSYNKLAYLLMSIDGITDYNDITINNEKISPVVPNNALLKIGTVVINGTIA